MLNRFHALSNSVMLTYLKRIVYPRIQEELTEGKELQQELLKAILQKTEKTKFGTTHNFSHIAKYKDTYKAFTQRVEISDYEGMKHWIEEAKEKENIIWPGKIKRFSASAGTTSRKKHIPITEECLESMGKAGLDMFANYAIKNPETEIFSGVFWPLIGSIQEEFTDGSIVSDVSALLAIERNILLKQKYAFPLEMLLEKSRSVKRKTCCDALSGEEKIVIMGVTSRINEILIYLQKEYPKKGKKNLKNLQLIIW